MNTNRFLIPFMAGLLFFTACKKDDEEEDTTESSRNLLKSYAESALTTYEVKSFTKEGELSNWSPAYDLLYGDVQMKRFHLYDTVLFYNNNTASILLDTTYIGTVVKAQQDELFKIVDVHAAEGGMDIVGALGSDTIIHTQYEGSIENGITLKGCQYQINKSNETDAGILYHQRTVEQLKANLAPGDTLYYKLFKVTFDSY